jgi:cytochrome c oxidase subunit II
MMQSVLDPGGPQADRIAHLTMILFGGGSAILLLVLAAIGLALWGPSAVRRMLASDRLVIAAGIVFPVALLSALLAYGLVVMRSSIAQADTKADVTIHVVGEQWWWRVAYAGADGTKIAEANEVRLPVGRIVEMVLTSPDVIHSAWIPALAGKVDMIPGRTNRLVLEPTRAGVFRGQCAEFCGTSHALMAFAVVVMEPEAFDAWLAREAAPAAGAGAGAELFVALGCGGCHAIRGTAARGVIGPDLTHVGGRETLGAGILPNGHAAFVRWIAATGEVKPEVRMPAFGMLPRAELEDLARYLGSLR